MKVANKVRVGIDFGYKYTGIAILNQANTVLDYAVIEHKNISGTLLSRRANRSARRRKHTKKVRLRNFYALLKGMGIEPREITKESTEADKNFIGNRLYAMAHRRGWDYSSLVELLVDGEGRATSTVRKIDRLLVKEFQAPYTKETKTRKGKQYTDKKIIRTCLGELAEYGKIINSQRASQEEKQEAEIEYDKLRYELENSGLNEIRKYINKRLTVSGVASMQQDDATDHILVLLGLNIGEKLHNAGKLYTPHKNRHRDEFTLELGKKMKDAFSELSVKQKAEQQALRFQITVEEVQKKWLKNAKAILDPNNPDRGNASRKKNNKDIRPARFQNRHIGKCPVNLGYGKRCNHNLPKKSHEDVRKLQFEIEARQMNIKDGGSLRKLTEKELKCLIGCVDFEHTKLVDNGEKWKGFFEKCKTLPVKENARGKKDILKDIATGRQDGRSNLCRNHLKEKLQLIKDNKTESAEWARLHEERILSIFSNDAPPSIRQKVEVVISRLKKLLRKHGYDLNNIPIEHIGIETARFDISALAQNEGKKLKKKKDYQSKSSRKIDDLKADQGNKCLYCGLDLGPATVEHIFPRARGGSDKALNRAAAHDICNINKGKGFVRINRDVLNIIEKKNLKKFKYITKGQEKGWSIADESLAGAQHTMFGAKLLKGSLITALQLKQLSQSEINKVFPKVKPREVDLLRRTWFPVMAKQKSAIRYRDNDNIKTIKLEIDGNHPGPLVIRWSKKISGVIDIRLDKPERIKSWVKYETTKEQDNWKTTVTIDSNHVFTQGDEGILSYRFNVVDKKTGEIKQYKKFHVVIRSSKRDGIHQFHHAMDAIIVATNVDWSHLNRIDHKSRTDDSKYLRKFKKAIHNICPKIGLDSIRINGRSEYIAPEKSSFFHKDKQDQSKPKVSKTDTQALRLKNGNITQRKALYDIGEKNVCNIQSHRIKSLMAEAFSTIKNKNAEDKKQYLSKSRSSSQQDIFITQDYFLSLPTTHKLHPTNTRSVRCLVKGTGEDQMFKIVDRNNNGEHFYKRIVAWEKAVIYEYFDKEKKKIAEARLKGDFYLNSHNRQTELPEGAKITKEFRRGDTVKIRGVKDATWKISKLGSSATLLPQNVVAENLCNAKGEKTARYAKLEKVPT